MQLAIENRANAEGAGAASMYAIEFFFDTQMEDFVKDIWTGLKINGITSNMADIDELRPHITVAVYNSDLPIELLVRRFDTATKQMSPIDVKFDVVAAFPTSGTVFVSPTITSQLFESHRQFYYSLGEYDAFANEYYIPDSWVPHCTLAIMLNQNLLLKTLEYCLNRFNPLKGRITEIGVVKLEYLDSKCVSSKTIFSNLLC